MITKLGDIEPKLDGGLGSKGICTMRYELTEVNDG